MQQETVHYNVRELVGEIALRGEDLRDRLLEHLARGEHVTLDFAGMRVVFPMFMAVAIGHLMKTYEPPFVRQHITFLNLPFRHNETLECWIEDAYRYHHDRHYRWAVSEGIRLGLEGDPYGD